MPEKICPKCGGAMSRVARSCPHCGHRLKSGAGAGIGVAVGLLVLAAAGYFVVKASGGLHLSFEYKRPKANVITLNRPVPPPTPTSPAPAPKPTPPKPAPPSRPAAPPKPAPPPKPVLAQGMTMEQVRNLLGEPAKTRSATGPNLRLDWWDYDSGEELRFVDSVLQGWSKRAAPGGSAGVAKSASAPVIRSRARLIYAELRAQLALAKLTRDLSQAPPAAMDAFTGDVRNRYGLTLEQQREILKAGDSAGWPVLPILIPGRAHGPRPSVGVTYLVPLGLVLDLGPKPPPARPTGEMRVPPGAQVRVVLPRSGWYGIDVLDAVGGVTVSGWTPYVTAIAVERKNPAPGRAADGAHGSKTGNSPSLSGRAGGPVSGGR